MNLIIKLPEEDVQVLKAKATAREWLRKSWATAKASGLDQLSMDEIDSEIEAARKSRRETKPQPGA